MSFVSNVTEPPLFVLGFIIGIVTFFIIGILFLLIENFIDWIESINETIHKYDDLKKRIEKLEKEKKKRGKK